MRIEKGLSQAQVAEALKVSQAQYQKYETGKSETSFRMIHKICALYGVFPGQLMMGRATTIHERIKEMDPKERQQMIEDLEGMVRFYRAEAESSTPAEPPGEAEQSPS